MDKIFQSAVSCSSLYGLICVALICITIVIVIFFIYKAISTYNCIHATFHGTSVQSEIDLHDKAA